jgi:hypothetical protein
VTTHATDTEQQEAIEREARAGTDERPPSTGDSEGRRPTDEDRATARESETAEPERSAAPERAAAPDDQDTKRAAPLFADDAATELRERWTEVQTRFVDEPRNAVEQADALVAEVMKRLTDSFATERQALEQQWSRGDDVSTEELRLALRRYRSFFDRLLSV